ncbi:hypothetical protein [Lactobacillus helveticus]|uniref:hypothetical protein n=1 Tax=Lactobacillus helveticus TaxID=1587 RepID=UPI00156737D5|nr:hypothetical protein [Lactobacillus helveticus]NRO92506.1 hypothetical protein [Lactobacillus helveticus]
MANENLSKNAELAIKAQKQKQANAKSIEKAEVKSIVGQTKTVKIMEDTKHEWSMTMRHPGVPTASSILDDAVNRFNNPTPSTLVSDCIDQGIIVSPHITSIDFFNTHDGFYEVAGQLYSFLTQRM